jgi:hypothetical protein
MIAITLPLILGNLASAIALSTLAANTLGFAGYHWPAIGDGRVVEFTFIAILHLPH